MHLLSQVCLYVFLATSNDPWSSTFLQYLFYLTLHLSIYNLVSIHTRFGYFLHEISVVSQNSTFFTSFFRDWMCIELWVSLGVSFLIHQRMKMKLRNCRVSDGWVSSSEELNDLSLLQFLSLVLGFEHTFIFHRMNHQTPPLKYKSFLFFDGFLAFSFVWRLLQCIWSFIGFLC